MTSDARGASFAAAVNTCGFPEATWRLLKLYNEDLMARAAETAAPTETPASDAAPSLGYSLALAILLLAVY